MSNILSAVTRQNLHDFVAALDSGWRPSRVEYHHDRHSDTGYFIDYSIWTEVILRDWVEALKELDQRFPNITLSTHVWDVAIKNASAKCVQFLWQRNNFRAGNISADFEHQCLLALIVGMGDPWSPAHEIKDVLPIYSFLKSQGLELNGVVRGAFDTNDLRVNGHSLWTRAVFIKNWDLVEAFWPSSAQDWRGWSRLNETLFHLMNVVVGDYRSLVPSTDDSPEEEVLFHWLRDFSKEWMVSPTVPSTLLLVEQNDFGVTSLPLEDDVLKSEDPAFRQTEHQTPSFEDLLEVSNLAQANDLRDEPASSSDSPSSPLTPTHSERRHMDRRAGDRRHAVTQDESDVSLGSTSLESTSSESTSREVMSLESGVSLESAPSSVDEDEASEYRFDWNQLMKEAGYEVEEECLVQPIPLYRVLSRPSHEKISPWLRLSLMVKKERREELWKIWDYVLSLDCELSWLHELAMYPDDADVQKVILLARLDRAIPFHRFWVRPSASGFSAHERWVNMGGDPSVVELWVPHV